MNKLEPPKRVARVRNVRRATKIKKIVAGNNSTKKPVLSVFTLLSWKKIMIGRDVSGLTCMFLFFQEVPEEYRPSEWLAETVPKKAPYYPQMGDEVMFFQQGYNLYLDAVQNKNIYKVRPAQLNPWGKIKLKVSEVVQDVIRRSELEKALRLCHLLGTPTL